jgi:gliding motility-associated-like protein
MKNMLGRKVYYIWVLLIWLFGINLTAQNGVWTWMKGSQTPTLPAVYGTQGVSSPTNDIHSVYEAGEWTDLNGNFWIFGGVESVSLGYYSSLWRYTPSNNEWTWMKGPSTTNAAGVYGIQGVPSPANYPGARSLARTWTDNNGNLWLFGGNGYDVNGNLNVLNDLWKYDIATNEWTWMSGSQTGNPAPNFGIQGVPSPSNIPAPSVETVATWIDAAGNLWMFGGLNALTLSTDDMWKYDVSTNIWTWMSGQSSGQVFPNYGLLGVPSPSNTPGGRYIYGHWQDQQGNFWMFGGVDATTNAAADMWMYNPNTLIWTWMAGSNVSLPPASNNTFTTQCIAGGYPDGIFENRACWTDPCGRFWGMGTDFNYLWFFDPATLQFTWVTGSLIPQPSPVYGTQTVPAPGNVPAPVMGGNGFVDNAGDLWLFGGFNSFIGELNQVWRYQIDPNCSPQNFQINFPIVTPTSACAGSPVNFSPLAENNYDYFWDFGDTTLSTDTSSQINATWTYNQAGTYTYTLIVTNNYACGPGEDTLTGTITIYPEPTVNLGSDSILCNVINSVQLDAGNPGENYLWNTGATSQTITTTLPGTYYVTVTTDPAGNCSASDTIVFTQASQITLGPDTTICAGTSVMLDPGITLQQYLWNTGDTTQAIMATTGGVYTVQIITAACTLSTSLTLTVQPLPVVNLGNDTTLCGTVNLLLDAGNPGTTFLWSTGATSQTITANAAGSYSVLVSDSLCSNQDSIVISLQTVPAPSIGGDTSICAGQTLLLDPGISAQQFIWNTGDTTSTLLVSTSGFYSVQVINTPCTLTTSMNLTVTPLPVVALGADTTLCPGTQLVLDAQNAGANYNWSTGATAQSIAVTDAGTYAVTITSQNCNGADTINISIAQNIDFDETVSLCGSPGGILLDAGNPGATYLWSTGQTTQTISIQQAGTYWVSINAAPCILSDTIQVTGSIGEANVYIPNSFTPNGDGLNDRFSGIGEDFTSFHLVIFNRWGELIFETRDQSGWDGNYVGQRTESEVYVYLLSYTSTCTGGKVVERRGAVTLIR